MDLYGMTVLAIGIVVFAVIRRRATKYPKNIPPTQAVHEKMRDADDESNEAEIKHYTGTKLGEMGINPATGKYGKYMGGGAWLE